MTTANHALIGSLIAVSFKNPAVVLPAALVSHYVLDALPHFGNTNAQLNATQAFRKYAYVELLSLLGVLALVSTGIYGFNIVTLAALVACLPDLEWPVRYLFYERRGRKPPATPTAHYHKKLQTLEREWGILIELTFFTIGFWALTTIT